MYLVDMQAPMATMGIVASPEGSPLADALTKVGDRWSLLVVEALLRGPRRFNELSHDLPEIAPNILSGRLKHLEREGLVFLRPYSDRPPRLEYGLTALGAELAGAVRLLAHWGSRAPGSPGSPRHSACGSPLEARWYCPTCARIVEDHDDAELRYL
jgi:DNA-binding HxlR family transcriptional regulator